MSSILRRHAVVLLSRIPEGSLHPQPALVVEAPLPPPDAPGSIPSSASPRAEAIQEFSRTVPRQAFGPLSDLPPTYTDKLVRIA